jgi:hypothetical protein
LRRIEARAVKANQPIRVYIGAFNGFEPLGACFLGAGRDSIAIKLPSGAILKIIRRELPEEAGTRPFDMPILDRGCRHTKDGLVMRYYIQPEAATRVLDEIFYPFAGYLYDRGYELYDYGKRQLGYYNGEIKLLDPFAALKRTEIDAWRQAHWRRFPQRP